MCTVTFIPVHDRYFITSNRDEKLSRKKALAPAVYELEGINFLFPKDTDAGGTWITAKDNGDVAVLLNGAFINHIAEPPYRKSRGLILLDILAGETPSVNFIKKNLENIEPFTIVLIENKSLYELRWDGVEKYCRQLSINTAYIWSSVTLYDGLTVLKREKWFADFLNQPALLSQQSIINFHRFTGDGDSNNDVLMHRDGLHRTVSITGIEIQSNKLKMLYLDLNDNKTYFNEALLSTLLEK